jgi:hypothetical protein
MKVALMAEPNQIGNVELRNLRLRHRWPDLPSRPAQDGKKMMVSVKSTAFPADAGRVLPLRRNAALVALAFVALVVVPGTAGAAKGRPAGAPGGFEGNWNVMIITQAGACDQAYSFPVTIAGGRVIGGGPANVSGSVGRGGSVAVRVSAGASFASGSGRLGASSGGGRWSGRGSAGVCSGRWQATRS